MKYQVLFSLKNNEKVFMNVICCTHDWPFEGLVITVLLTIHSELMPKFNGLQFQQPRPI